MSDALAVAPATSAPELRTERWALTSAEQAGIIRDLRFRYFKWDAFTGGVCRVVPETMVLSRSTHEEIVRIVETLSRALERFERRVGSEGETLRRLGIPGALDPLMGGEDDETLQIARYDLFLTEEGRWMVSEFNEDAPGGFNETAGLPELLGDLGGGLTWEGDLCRHLLAALRPYDSIALLYATAYAEDLQHMLILERWLEAAGHRTVLASPEHLRAGLGRPRVLGTPIDAAFRFFPGEWMPRLPNIRTWLKVAARLPVMNPLRRLVRQSKSMFALWREEAFLDPEDRRLVDEHCPWTESFDPDKVPMLVEERERWVLKGAFGRMGDSVVIGTLVTEKEWSESLARAALSPRDFCVQERFAVRPLAFEQGALYPTVGAYVVNGRFAGYYSRAAARPLITHEAYHVATAVAST
ncbi:MAG TPA: glutathionylspermidine synthase family protein [Thermoanaerobaculia bacterium]|nr:glutathionylspermidine synthase family protein [Thermoanaerobaculia bacterium]